MLINKQMEETNITPEVVAPVVETPVEETPVVEPTLEPVIE
jgi:hypothetical protein